MCACACAGCLGITLSFHRQLSHRSFTTPKWLEYALAYCGVLAVQGEPIEWASSHRYHHLHTDTPLDPHSPYEGFWWSHMGWLLNNGVSAFLHTMYLAPPPQCDRTHCFHCATQFALQNHSANGTVLHVKLCSGQAPVSNVPLMSEWMKTVLGVATENTI